MVLVLDVKMSEISAHTVAVSLNLICIRQLIRARAVQNRIFFPIKKTIFLNACATCFELPSNISTMGATESATLAIRLTF